jgi:hypothetical protein
MRQRLPGDDLDVRVETPSARPDAAPPGEKLPSLDQFGVKSREPRPTQQPWPIASRPGITKR